MVITNLVVALMIVSNGLERCDAVSVHKQFNPEFYSWITFSDASVETMWREKAFTNFIYSTRIQTECIKGYCPKCVNGRNVFPVGAFYGKPIHEIWFEEMPYILCEKCLSEQARKNNFWSKYIGD